MNTDKEEWHVGAVSNLSLECECKKEFQVFATTLKNAAVQAERILKKDGDQWKVRQIWWLDPSRSRIKD